VIRARNIDTQSVSEFVPTSELQGEVPNALLNSTVLVFHESSHSLKIYPMFSWWAVDEWDESSTSPAWTMHLPADPLATTIRPQLTRTYQGVKYTILSPRSLLVETLSVILQPLEACITNLLVVWESMSQDITYKRPSYSSGHLQVSIPRYKLCFFVNAEGNLECKDFPGLFISRTQSIDTLLGLKNKLVLKPKDDNMTSKVIIPEGKITASHNPHLMHPEVTIVPREDAGQQSRTFIYDVDKLIGRLTGDGTMASWYMLVYLHILTSSHLPDPLTHRTGMHQALVMLKSANSFSFTQLSTEDMSLLELIHNVTPVRRYYPVYLKSMETVHWNPNLSPLSQSELFAPLVESILEYHNNQALFELTPTKDTVKYKGETALRERAEFRNYRLVSYEIHETHIFRGKL
jgi:hypothetical protein